jgi:putative flippase GtrA
MRGLSLVIMIQCHAFNSFARLDLHGSGVYALSQFVGGMAGPLFLFMAGMTFAFQMESLQQREPVRRRRWFASLRRAGYILGVAFLIRITNWVTSWPHTGWREIVRVDILNSMGLAMAVFSVAALLDGGPRLRVVLLAAGAIAAVSPFTANFNWSVAPPLLHEYLAPGAGRGHFPFFPCASYVGFGMTAGAAVRRAGMDRMDRLTQWAALFGGALILGGQYVSNLPYAVYPKSNFWTDSPTLVLIRVGISLVLLAASYMWTAYCVGPGWSWIQCLGRNSLLVYWVHLMLVYGAVTGPIQHALPILLTALATLTVTALMVALSALWQWWKGRRGVKPGAANSPSPGDSTVPSPLPPG